jgi:dTDP-4-dehydrorhamnose 3,5-epimerase-like enzyme
LAIDWNLGDIEPVISEKDKRQLSLKEFLKKHA